MSLDIITYPNKHLFLPSKEVENFDSSLHTLLDNMYETMIQGQGVGLAAIQVDVPLRIFLANPPNEQDEQTKETLLEIINPELEFINDEKILFTEGCLSIPGFYEEVQRNKNVYLKYQDRHGKYKELEASDFLAVILQHEFDHLNGKLFIERLSYLKRQKFDKEFRKTQKNSKKAK